ncbi:MAG: AAA family ATPase [Lachnospiraceae bacterium]|nr:AAA family ATPase [Lachnospiraceae bacterium]
MKKLNLLAPEIVNGFMEGRGRECIKYLQLSSTLGKSELLEDIRNGAPFFNNLKEQLESSPAKTVVIRADNEEEGYMALSYLAAVYNETDNIDLMSDVCADDDLSEETGEDYFEAEFGDDEDDPLCEAEVWRENALKIPLISAGDISMYLGGPEFDVFGSDGFGMQGRRNFRQRDPWWSACRNEPVCIVNEPGNMFGFSGVYQNFSTRIGSFFKNNRHLYVLDIKRRSAELFQMLDSDDMEFGGKSYEDPEFTRMVLEQAALVIDVKTADEKDKEKVRNYRISQFENWVEKEGFSLNEGFQTAKIVSRIVHMHNPGKSELMHQILRYIRERGNSGKVLKERDFDILKRFANLTDKAQLEKAGAASKKLDREIFGLDNVKSRVREIVDVLSYHKRRESLGLDKGQFHNVHLFIGAPGVAKTTVAKYMGNMMMERNLLPGNRFTCVNGADLKGMYVGHTAPKVHRLFEENDIIMIDEAYSLVATDLSNSSGDMFSQEAVATLITEIEEHGTEKLVIFAGYGGIKVPKKDNLMKRFIDSNPGLKSRINSTVYFDSYSPEDMVGIVHTLAKSQQFSVSRKADELIREYFMSRVGDRTFGNGREARSLLEIATIFAAQRTKELKGIKSVKRKFMEITVSDIRQAIERQKMSDIMQRGNMSRLGFGA